MTGELIPFAQAAARIRPVADVLPEFLPALIEPLPASGFILADVQGFIPPKQARFLAVEFRRAADTIDPPMDTTIKSCVRRDDGHVDLVIDGVFTLSRLELLARSIRSMVSRLRHDGAPSDPGGHAA